MTEVPIWDPVERFLYGFAIGLLYVVSILWFRKAFGNENKNERMFIFGTSGYLFFGSIYFMLMYFNEFFVLGSVKGFTFFGNYQNSLPIYEFIGELAALFLSICYTVFMFYFERIYKRTRYVMTVFNCSMIILRLIIFQINPSLSSILSAIHGIFFIFGIVIPYYLYTKWADKDFKIIGLTFYFAVWIMLSSFNLSQPGFKALSVVPIVIPAIIHIFVSFLLLLLVFMPPERLSQLNKYSNIIGLTCVILMGLIFIVAINVEGISITYTAMYLMFFIMCLFLTPIIIRNSRREAPKRSESDSFSVLEVFSRPKNITEEEIGISIEKKICLVCKSTISGVNFICGACGAFSCYKCYNALKKLENACWSCNSALDKSKPVKLAMDKDLSDELSIEGKSK